LKFSFSFFSISAIAIFGIFAYNKTIAQHSQWSDEFKIKSNEVPDAIIGRIGQRLYSTRFRSVPFSNDELSIDMFDASGLTYQGSITLLPRNTYIEDGNLKALPEFENIMVFSHHIVLFLSAFDKTRAIQILYGLVYDSHGQFLEMKRLAETRNASRPNKGQFVLVQSPDNKKLWLMLSNPQKDENAFEFFEFFLYDENLDLLANRTLNLPYKDRYFEMINILPDDAENLFLLGKIYKAKEDKEKGMPDYDYSVFKLRLRNPETVQELLIREKAVFLSDLTLAFSGRNLALTGFFAETSINGISGTVFIRIRSDSLQMLSSDRLFFDKYFVMEALGEKKMSRNNYLPRFVLKQVVTDPTGEIWVVGEQYWMQEVCVRDARGFLYCNYYYFYNSIIAVKLDTNGKIQQNYVIPKFQNSMDDDGYYLSYALAKDSQGLNFVYLDNPKNREVQRPSEFKSMNRPQKADVVCVTLRFDGTITKKILWNTEQEGWTLRPKFSKQTAEDELIILAVSGSNRVRMCKIHFSMP